MLHRIRNSLKYRLFYGWCKTLERHKTSRLPPINWDNLQVDPQQPDILCVTRASDVPLLHYCLYSLAQTHRRIPPIRLVGDSPSAVDEIRTVLGRPGPIVSVRLWLDQLDVLPAAMRAFCETWLTSQPFGGYARKFAASVSENHERAFTLIDADVLFFGPFFQALAPRLLSEDCPMLAGRDPNRAYDLKLADALVDPTLKTAPPLNCGVIYYPEGSLMAGLKDIDFHSLEHFARDAHPHLEQTLIAHAFHRKNGAFFDDDLLATHDRDNFRRHAAPTALARHYAGAKHLFWRDAGRNLSYAPGP